MNNVILKYEEMPQNLLGFYTNILNSEYIILNKLHDISKLHLAAFSCLYFKENGYNVGKIEVSDLEKEDFEPVLYGKKQLIKILEE